MKYSKLGNTGLIVSRLSFGTMTFGVGAGPFTTVSKVDENREDGFTPLEETVDALNALVRSGKVRYLGYSNWSAWRAAAAIHLQKANGLAQFCSGQMHYALTCRDIENEVIPFMQYSGVGLTVWSPLSGGFLSGKYTRENLKNPENRLSGFDLFPHDKESGFALVERLREMGKSRNASVAQIAIAWLLAKPSVSSVIIGASKAQQLDNNVGAMDIVLSPEELAELDSRTAPAIPYPGWFSARTVDAVHKAALQP